MMRALRKKFWFGVYICNSASGTHNSRQSADVQHFGTNLLFQWFISCCGAMQDVGVECYRQSGEGYGTLHRSLFF